MAFLASKVVIRPAILHDYCRHKVEFCDYPGIVPEKGHSVRGTYVTGLTDGDIYRLDSFEGPEYNRQKVKVSVLKEDGQTEGEEVEAETYVYIAGKDQLEDQEWDYDEFRLEKMHRWADQSDEYQGELWRERQICWYIDKEQKLTRPLLRGEILPEDEASWWKRKKEKRKRNCAALSRKGS